MSMQDELELKPCPFCGEAPRRVEHPHSKILTCSKVFCMANGMYFSPELWNIRPIEDALRSENETLRARCEAYHKALEVNKKMVSFYAGITNSLGKALDAAGLEAVGLDQLIPKQKALFEELGVAMRALEAVCPK